MFRLSLQRNPTLNRTREAALMLLTSVAPVQSVSSLIQKFVPDFLCAPVKRVLKGIPLRTLRTPQGSIEKNLRVEVEEISRREGRT